MPTRPTAGPCPVSVLLVVDAERPECVIPRRGRLRTRLWTNLHAASLDQALAAGASPDSTPALSMRAAQLIRATTRRKLARSLRRLVDDAKRPSIPRGPGVFICRRKILASREALLELADRLTGQEPVDARGVAQIRLIVIGVVGALYERPGADDLAPLLEAALDALELSI